MPDLDITKLTATVSKKRKNFDLAKIGAGQTVDAWKPVVRYGVGKHAKSDKLVADTTTNVLQNKVDYDRLKSPIFHASNHSMTSVWDLYLQAFLDGYAVAEALTGPVKKPKLIGSAAAVTKFVKTAAERASVAVTGSLAPVFDALLGEAFTRYGEGLREATAAAFVVGAKLRCYEGDTTHELLADLFDGPKKPRGAPIPKGKAPATKDSKDLLAEILAKPDDDGPRLVYGDFLAANDDARGEFIQLQCKLGNVIYSGSKTSDIPNKVENAEALAKRAVTLLKNSRGTWLPKVKIQSVNWARGFPRDVTTDASELIAKQAEFDLLPFDELALIHWNGKLADAIAKCAPHPTARSFWFGSGFGAKTMHAMCAPMFTGARELEGAFWDDKPTPIPDKALDAFARATFAHLEKLVGRSQMIAAFDRAKCPRLETLELDAWELAPLAETALWKKVKRIEVYRLEADSELGALAGATALASLWANIVELDAAKVKELVAIAPKSLKKLEGAFAELDKKLVALLAKRFELVAS